MPENTQANKQTKNTLKDVKDVQFLFNVGSWWNKRHYYRINLSGSILSIAVSGRHVQRRLHIDLEECIYFLFIHQYSSLYGRTLLIQTCPFENHSCWNRKMCYFGMQSVIIRALHQCPNHSGLIRSDFCQFSRAFSLPLSSHWPNRAPDSTPSDSNWIGLWWGPGICIFIWFPRWS